MDLDQIFESEKRAILQNLERQRQAIEELKAPLLAAARAIRECLASGGKILFFGNGGSAADAQHWAAEFSGRYLRARSGLAAVALTTDTSALTAIANDYGFEDVFARQVGALARRGDVAVGIQPRATRRTSWQHSRRLVSWGASHVGRPWPRRGPRRHNL